MYTYIQREREAFPVNGTPTAATTLAPPPPAAPWHQAEEQEQVEEDDGREREEKKKRRTHLLHTWKIYTETGTVTADERQPGERQQNKYLHGNHTRTKRKQLRRSSQQYPPSPRFGPRLLLLGRRRRARVNPPTHIYKKGYMPCFSLAQASGRGGGDGWTCSLAVFDSLPLFDAVEEALRADVEVSILFCVKGKDRVAGLVGFEGRRDTGRRRRRR